MNNTKGQTTELFNIGLDGVWDPFSLGHDHWDKNSEDRNGVAEDVGGQGEPGHGEEDNGEVVGGHQGHP